jgi:putative tricarboxylic transport membrane protein
MGTFGLLGYFFRRHHFPLAPLLIAFILEPIGERSIRQALSLSNGDLSIFVTRPISLLFLILAVLAIYFSRKKKTGKVKGAHTLQKSSGTTPNEGTDEI